MPVKDLMVMAMDNANEGITIADASQPDMPLVYVNKGFLRMTGYNYEDVLHRNCRFLQGAESNQPAVAKLREAVNHQQPVQVVLHNFRKDGTPFFNRLSLTPLFDQSGQLTHYIGVQEDITELRKKEETARRLAHATLAQTISEQVRQDERETIGRELHDNINQLLATSRLLLNVRAESPAQQQDLIENSSALITNAIEEIRTLTHRLVAPRTAGSPLSEDLHTLVAQLAPALPFAISLTVSLDDTCLSAAQTHLFYRVVQEGVNNCIKYANPSQLSIVLQQCDKELELLIEDNGQGFEPALQSEGIGLRNMRSRVEKENGTLQITSAAGQGCRLRVLMPFSS